MISQMRVHHQKIAKVLTDFPAQGQQWAMWLAYHQFQVNYFQKNRDGWALAALGLFLGALMLTLAGAAVSLPELLIVAVITWLAFAGVWYYLCLYTRILRQMETQSELLFEKTLAIETKPNQAVAKYWLDLAGQLVSGRARRARQWRGDD